MIYKGYGLSDFMLSAQDDLGQIKDENNVYEDYFCIVEKDFDSAVKHVMDYEERFILDHDRGKIIGSSLVYFGKIVASV